MDIPFHLFKKNKNCPLAQNFQLWIKCTQPLNCSAKNGVHVTYGGMSKRPVTAATSHLIFKVSKADQQLLRQSRYKK